MTSLPALDPILQLRLRSAHSSLKVYKPKSRDLLVYTDLRQAYLVPKPMNSSGLLEILSQRNFEALPDPSSCVVSLIGSDSLNIGGDDSIDLSQLLTEITSLLSESVAEPTTNTVVEPARNLVANSEHSHQTISVVRAMTPEMVNRDEKNCERLTTERSNNRQSMKKFSILGNQNNSQSDARILYNSSSRNFILRSKAKPTTLYISSGYSGKKDSTAAAAAPQKSNYKPTDLSKKPSTYRSFTEALEWWSMANERNESTNLDHNPLQQSLDAKQLLKPLWSSQTQSKGFFRIASRRPQ